MKKDYQNKTDQSSIQNDNILVAITNLMIQLGHYYRV